MDVGASGAKEAGYMILVSIGILVGLSLEPTIVSSIGPVWLSNKGQLEATVLQFVAVGLPLALLVIAFGVSFYIARSGMASMQSKPVALIVAVIVLVIGIGLVQPIDQAKDTALRAVCGTSQLTSGEACTSDALSDGTASFGGATLANSSAEFKTALTLAKTVLDYVVIGFILSLLTAAFSLANMGTGASSRIGGYVRSRRRRR